MPDSIDTEWDPERILTFAEVLAMLCYLSHWFMLKEHSELSSQIDRIYSELLDYLPTDFGLWDDDQDFRKNVA